MVDTEDIDSDDYYKVLGVSNNSSDDDIKKKYRKLSLKYHPDRHLDNKQEYERIFKKISEAYEVLLNKQKRSVYDQLGKEGLKGNINSGNPFDIFNSIFKGGMQGFPHQGFGMPGFVFPTNQKERKQRFEKINLTLEQLYNGYKEIRNVKERSTCNECKGFGSCELYICNKCKGNGIINQIQQLAPGFITQTQSKCDQCLGEGKIGDKEKKCKRCIGEKEIDIVHILNIEFPPGVDKGYSIKIEFEEHQYIFSIDLNSHNLFKREGNNIIYEKDISLCDALCFVEFELKLLNGENIMIKTPDNMVIKPNTVHVLTGLGLPIYGKQIFGDLKIIFNIVFPNKISYDRKEYLYKILTSCGLPKTSINDKDIKVVMLDNEKLLNNKKFSIESDEINIPLSNIN